MNQADVDGKACKWQMLLLIGFKATEVELQLPSVESGVMLKWYTTLSAIIIHEIPRRQRGIMFVFKHKVRSYEETKMWNKLLCDRKLATTLLQQTIGICGHLPNML